MKNFFNFRLPSQLQRYKKWRAVGKKLNQRILEQASQDVLLRAAADLRLRKKNNLLRFDSESDTHFLMDRIIHDIFLDGRRVIELYRDQNKETLTADEQKLIDALVDSDYSLFIVRKTEADHGLHLTDAFTDKEIFLIDINLSQTAVEGHALAMRVVSIEDIAFSTGCACPFPAKHLPRLKDNFVRLFEKKQHQMTWGEMMRQYNPYFFLSMKQAGIKIDFGDVV